MYKKITPDFSFTDERGSLTQLVHKGYTQVNVLVSKQKVQRGGHYHKISKEAFFVVSGSVAVTFKKGEQSEKIIFREGDFFEVFPMTIHSMEFLENCVLVAMYDKPVEREDGTKDIYSE